MRELLLPCLIIGFVLGLLGTFITLAVMEERDMSRRNVPTSEREALIQINETLRRIEKKMETPNEQ